jgi:hypothetical protein
VHSQACAAFQLILYMTRDDPMLLMESDEHLEGQIIDPGTVEEEDQWMELDEDTDLAPEWASNYSGEQ